MIHLDTERLHIRSFRSSDWEALHDIIAAYESSELAAYDHPWPTSPAEIRQITEWFASGDSYLAVCQKATGHCIGFVALNPEPPEDSRVFNLGYVFDFAVHGKGYATEACQAVLQHAFDHLQARQVVSSTAAANRSSCRLLERLGFTKIAETISSLRSAPDGTPIQFSGCTFALTREQWQLVGDHRSG